MYIMTIVEKQTAGAAVAGAAPFVPPPGRR